MGDQGNGGLVMGVVAAIVLMCLSDGLQHQFDTVDKDGFTVHSHDAAVLCLAAE